MDDQNSVQDEIEQEPLVSEGEVETAAEVEPVATADGAAAPEAAAQGDETGEVTAERAELTPSEEAIYTIRLLTAVAVGTVVEGSDQLVVRLKSYAQELHQTLELGGEATEAALDEDEFDRLRYATIGLIFETQNLIGRSLALTAQAAETTINVTNRLTKPFRDFFLFRPVTKRVEKRFDQMAEHGQDSFARWIEIGRQVEPQSRLLATKTYEEIVDEFINRLADNPEIQALITQQSLSLAAGVRDEVRERTVTGDNVLEDIARRILRRQPRPELAAPPPEVQRWAGLSPDDFRELEQKKSDEQRTDSTQ